MYLAVSEHAVGAVLLKDQEGIQKPTYYISKTLVDAETRHLPLEKLALALVHVTLKSPHYFSSPHSICVDRVSSAIFALEVRLHGLDS